ncbi:MAG: response regulator transcription factor [Anaerolineales bacterium]|nr:response regulator transcription factor [Anaerolineales bacterium]MBX3006131.1 response regulator transcription factor [Anaerolineales bacterium]
MDTEAKRTVRVAVLEDHLSTVDGYAYRFQDHPHVELVASASRGDQLFAMLAEHPIDVLILDASVPMTDSLQAPYPLFSDIPKILAQYPKLAILLISGHKHPAFIRSVMAAGAKGYIVKSDAAATQRLAEIVTLLAGGGVYLSQLSVDALAEPPGAEGEIEMLTERQREVLSLCAAYPGMTTKQIAEKLGIAHPTVRTMLSLSYRRLRVNNMAAAILKARELGLITPLDDGYPFTP